LLLEVSNELDIGWTEPPILFLKYKLREVCGAASSGGFITQNRK